jgi:large repetitive protein
VVSNFHSTSTPLAGDGMLNANEAVAGMVVSGTAEVGAHILVHMQNGSEMTTTSDANGNWSVTFDKAHLPAGEGASSLTVTATDIAGNVAQYDQAFNYDTVAAPDPWVVKDFGDTNVISGIATATSSGTLSYHSIGADGHVTEITHDPISHKSYTLNGQSVDSDFALFDTDVPNGSYLIVSDTDAAGNEASTLFIRSTTGETTVDLSRSGLEGFDFGTINLTASTSSLTLTETQIKALTAPDKTLTIAGASDDHVTLVGATDNHTTQTIHGETYHLYTLGSEGAQVLIDSDIIVNTTGV